MSRPRFIHSAAVEAIVVGAIAVLVVGLVAYQQRDTSNQESPSPNNRTVAAPTQHSDATASTSTAVVTATSAAPDVLPIPAAEFGGLVLRRTDAAPLTTQQAAMQAVFDRGIPWGLGEPVDGRTPELIATHGLATFGSRAPSGFWVGDRNIPLPTGEILDHIEDRPVWILDYGNTIAWGSGGSYNHTVYAVDDITGGLMFAWFYNNDAEPNTEPPHDHPETAPTDPTSEVGTQ